MRPRSRPTPLRIPEALHNLADYFSQEKHLDRADIFRGWMYEAAERETVQAVSDGQMTIGQAVEMLEITYYDFYALAQKYGIEVGATADQFRESLKNIPFLKESDHNPKL